MFYPPLFGDPNRIKINPKFLLLIILLITASNTFAQVGIGTNTPAASAALEVSSSTNNKGILIPRITATQKNAISNPAEGLMIYQSSAPVGFYFYTGSAWKLMVTQTDLDTKVSTVDATLSLNTKVDKVTGKELSSNDYTTLEKTKLAAISGTNTGDQTTVSGNAGTSTKLSASKNINGVAFDGSTDITVTADAATLTGTALNSTVLGSSLTSVGTLGNLTVTNPIVGSVTGNAGTSTKLSASKNINGVAFDGSADITVAATAETLTGIVAIANGGTGATTLTANNVLLGNGTSALQAIAPGTNGNVLTSNGTTWASTAPSGGLPTTGNMSGDMLYWNKTAWVKVAPSQYEGAYLQSKSGVPTWLLSSGVTTAVVDVTNPTTGKIWMDRNLGASQVAISSTDADSYGDLYQWGRGADGHQLRNSDTTSTLSSTDVPKNASFILTSSSPNDWRSGQNANLWQGVNGVNNPCPSGYRLPTNLELDAERASWTSNKTAGAFASPLKLPLAGRRRSTGLIARVNDWGLYWSSTVSGTNSFILLIDSGNAYISNDARTSGSSVRCFKD